jgi:hypothetical protein
MPNKDNSENPSGDTDHQSPTLGPPPRPPQQGQVREPTYNDSADSQEDSKELAREIHWVEKATMLSQFILAVIGVFALVVYHGQLSVMQRQLDEMKESTKAAKASIDLTNESLLRDKRSWVGISTDPVPMLLRFVIDPKSRNYEIQWYFLIHNFGPGVAINVVENFEVANKHTLNKSFAETCEIAEKHYGKRTDSDIHDGYVLFPGQQIGVPGTELGNMEQLHSDGAAYVVGCILYEDQFGKRHKTTTCLQTLNDMDFGAVSNKPQNLFACEAQAN